MKSVKLSPLDVPYLAKSGGDLSAMEVDATSSVILKKGGGGPNSYEPVIRRFSDLSSGKQSLSQLNDWIDASGFGAFAPHLKACAWGFDEMLKTEGGIWRHRPSDERHVIGGLSTQSGVRGIWLHKDFRRACFINPRVTGALSTNVAAFLLRACNEVFVRDEPSVSEPCIVDLSMEKKVGSGDLVVRKANVLTPKTHEMMSLEEYEQVLRRFWRALERARIVPEGTMPRDIVGTLFHPDPGLFG